MLPEGAPESTERPKTARVFFALWPSAEVAAELADIARSTAGRLGGKPTRQETMHLTLAFLGQLPETGLPSLISVAAGVSGPAFALKVDHLDYWPNKQLLWAGCNTPDPALEQLAHRLQSALSGAGFMLETRPVFRPHLTLVRKLAASTRRLDLPRVALPDWSCSEFVLVRSQLSAAGAEYRILARFPLGA